MLPQLKMLYESLSSIEDPEIAESICNVSEGEKSWDEMIRSYRWREVRWEDQNEHRPDNKKLTIKDDYMNPRLAQLMYRLEIPNCPQCNFEWDKNIVGETWYLESDGQVFKGKRICSLCGKLVKIVTKSSEKGFPFQHRMSWTEFKESKHLKVTKDVEKIRKPVRKMLFIESLIDKT